MWAFFTGVWGSGGASWDILLAEARRDPRPRPRVRGVRRIMGRSLKRDSYLNRGIVSHNKCMRKVCMQSDTWVFL